MILTLITFGFWVIVWIILNDPRGDAAPTTSSVRCRATGGLGHNTIGLVRVRR